MNILKWKEIMYFYHSVFKLSVKKQWNVNVQSGRQCEMPLHTAITSLFHSNMKIVRVTKSMQDYVIVMSIFLIIWIISNKEKVNINAQSGHHHETPMHTAITSLFPFHIGNHKSNEELLLLLIPIWSDFVRPDQ